MPRQGRFRFNTMIDVAQEISHKNSPCVKCGAFQGTIFHEHHITYNPEKTAVLCESCHNRITRLNNSLSTFNKNLKLDNKLRTFLWRFFMQSGTLRSGFNIDERVSLIEWFLKD